MSIYGTIKSSSYLSIKYNENNKNQEKQKAWESSLVQPFSYGVISIGYISRMYFKSVHVSPSPFLKH